LLSGLFVNCERQNLHTPCICDKQKTYLVGVNQLHVG